MPTNGKPISVEDGNEIIKKYDIIKKDARDAIANALIDKSEETKAFFQGINLKNAFVFDGKLIKRFFENGHNADFIVVCLGGQVKKETGRVIGEPTVIVAGCRKDGNKFVTLKIDNPVSEHPPKELIAKLIEDHGDQKLSFNIV